MDPVARVETAMLSSRVEAGLGGDFRLLRVIGEGAVSRVYLASEIALQRLVAVKVMREELAGDQEALRRFTREARAAARIVHPNVVAIHRVGSLEDGTPYLLMEYVEGRTLEDLLLAEGPMQGDSAREVLVGIAAGLAAAHQKRVVHRDVRPANIMIERDTGRTVLTDFGIASVMESGSEVAARLTRAGQVLGEPRYLSPERLHGEPATTEADVFSFGVVGYELLTGAGPFPGATSQEVIAGIIRDPPRDLLPAAPAVDPEIARLLERCLAKKAAHRPAADDVLRALTRPAPSAGQGSHDHLFPAVALFLSELRRRRVYRVGAAYAAAVFILLQLASLILPALGAPSWAFRATVIACLAGFPAALVLGWLFDLTADGIRRTLDAAEGLQTRGIYRFIAAGALLLSVALAAFVAWRVAG